MASLPIDIHMILIQEVTGDCHDKGFEACRDVEEDEDRLNANDELQPSCLAEASCTKLATAFSGH
jgi:hypothetical protein